MSTSVASIQAELDLDAGRFHGSITMASGAVKKFNSTVDRGDKAIHRIERRVTGFGSALRDTMIVLGEFRAALYTIWIFTGQWVHAIVEANAKLERLQILMKGLSRASTEAGRVTESLENMAYVLDKAKNSPFTVDALADSFVKMKASGIDPTKGAIEALTEGVARFGGTSETMHRASIAIQQMSGKGVISMEELRQQLGEAVPNAMMLMAQSAGMSMGKLVKIIASGRLQASGALEKLFLEMRIQFAGSAENMMTTWSGMIQRLKTEWLVFANKIGEGGFFKAAKASLQELTTFLSSPEGAKTARDIGEALTYAVKMVSKFIRLLIENRQEIMAWGKLIVQVFAVKKIFDFTASIVGLTARVMDLSRWYGDLTKTMAKARAGTVAWSAAIGAAAGPIGIAITAIAGLVFWLRKQENASRAAGQAMLDYYEQTRNGHAVSDQEHADMQKKLALLQKIKDFRDRAQYGVDNGFSTATLGRYRAEAAKLIGEARKAGYITDGGNPFSDSLFTLQDSLTKLTTVVDNNLEIQMQEMANQTILRLKEHNSQVTSQFARDLEEKGEKIMTGVAGKLNEIQDNLNSGKISEKEGNKQRTDILTGAIDKRITMLKAAKNQLDAVIVNSADFVPEFVEASKANLDEVNKLLARAYDDRRIATAELKLLPKMSMGGDKPEEDPLVKYLVSVTKKVAEMKARVEDADPTMAGFISLLEDTKNNPLKVGAGDGGIIAEIKRQIEDLDKLEKQNTLKKITDDIKELEAAAASDLMVGKLETTNELYGRISQNMVSFNRKIAIMRMNWTEADGTVAEFNEKIKQTKEYMADLDFASLERFVTQSAWSAYLDSLPRRERELALFNQRIAENADAMARFKLQSPEKADEIDRLGAINENTIRQEYLNATKPAWASLLEDWNDTTTQMDQMWANTMTSFADTLTEALTTGKAGFRDFATAVLKEITRILLSKAIAQLAGMMLGMFGGSAYDGSAATGGYGSWEGAMAAAFAKGGIMTSKGPLPLNMYASGGIANSPQLAMFGEGRRPEAYVPLPDGRSIPVTMQGGSGVANDIVVNVQINQDGTSASDVQGQNDLARQLGAQVDARVRDTMAKEMRQGGLLWRMRNG